MEFLFSAHGWRNSGQRECDTLVNQTKTGHSVLFIWRVVQEFYCGRKSSAIILHFFCCEALNCYCTSWASQTHQTEVTWLLLLFTGIVYSASTQGCFKVVQNKRRVCWMLWNFKMAQIWTPQTDNLSSRFLPTERAQTTQQPDKDVSPSLMLLLFLINFE